MSYRLLERYRRVKVACYAGWLAAALLVCGASFEFVRVLCYVTRCVTNMFWVDEWVMMEELWRFRDGRYNLTYLWTPYWGHRIPIPRLIFLLDERAFHFSALPLVLLNLLMQVSIVAMISVLEWKLLSRSSRWLAVSAIAITSYLLFSGLQMENFVYGMSVQYGIGYASAVAGIAFGASSSKLFRGMSVTCGVISSLTIAAGLILWPVLILEQLLIGERNRQAILLALCGGLLAVSYSIGYSQPGNGMGIRGILHSPLEAIGIAAMFLGGPLSLTSLPWGRFAGAAAMIVSFYLVYLYYSRKSRMPLAFLILVLVSVWLIGISFSIPLARMRPEWVSSFHGVAPLPSRYFTASFLFWSCLTAATVSIVEFNYITRLLTAVCFVCFLALVVSTLTRESVYLTDWLGFCQRLDAVASGILMGVDDQVYMASSYPDQRLLDHWIPYARKYRLSVFAERRASWLNQPVSTILQLRRSSNCRLEIEKANQLGQDVRITGWIGGNAHLLSAQEDIAFTNSHGTVIGIGRTFMGLEQGELRRNIVGYAPAPVSDISAVYLIAKGDVALPCTAMLSKEVQEGAGLRSSVLRP